MTCLFNSAAFCKALCDIDLEKSFIKKYAYYYILIKRAAKRKVLTAVMNHRPLTVNSLHLRIPVLVSFSWKHYFGCLQVIVVSMRPT